MKKKAIIDSFNTFLLELTPNLITIAIFGTYLYTGHNIDAKSAFTLVSTLMALQMPIKQTPAAISAILDAKVALDRISKFLTAEEIQADYIKKEESLGCNGTAIKVKNGNFYWLTEEEKQFKKKKEEKLEDCLEEGKLILQDINLKIKKGSFVAILGE